VLVEVLSALLDVLLALFDELLPEVGLNAETTLLKSDCSVLMLLLAEEVADEPSILASNWEISCSRLLEKLE
jgi:hypothetical protein